MAWAFLFGGGVSGVVEYVLGVLKNALSSLTDSTKEKIQAALNIATRVLTVLKSLAWLIPTKWQTAYGKTIEAVQECVNDLGDLEITKEELDIIIDKVTATINAWNSPDDETCIDKVA